MSKATERQKQEIEDRVEQTGSIGFGDWMDWNRANHLSRLDDAADRYDKAHPILRFFYNPYRRG